MNKQKTNRTAEAKAAFPKRLRMLFCYIVPGLLVAALIASVVWGCAQRKKAEDLRANGEGLYRRTYQELTESVLDMRSSLSKLLVSEAPHTVAMTLDEIWRESGSISALLARIPQSHPDNYALNRFLVQTGDYCRQLTASVLSEKPISDSDRAQLLALYGSSGSVYEDLLERLNSGDFPASPITNEEFFDQSDAGSEREYPLIEYDGPFSDSTENRLPKLSGEPIGEQTALRRAMGILGTAELESTGLSSGRLPAYSFTGKMPDGRSVDIAIAEKGGALVYFMTSPSGDAEGIPGEEDGAALAEAGRHWLEDMGCGRMEPVYSRYCTGSVQLSYAAVVDSDLPGAEEGILVYGDMIRLWLDRTNGEVIGADIANWLYNHAERSFPQTIIPAEEARAELSPYLEVSGARLALIPLDNGTEKLCWEFRGGFSGSEYLVYMDAETGDEVRISLLVSDENGISPA